MIISVLENHDTILLKTSLFIKLRYTNDSNLFARLGNRMGSELFFQEVVSVPEICGADKFQPFFSNS